jgi:uncharacterized membrane protein
MKNYITTLFLLIALSSFSQADSKTTVIKFSKVDNEDLQDIIDILDIQHFNVICEDTLMRGKKYFISISEFQNGSIIKKDTSYSKCKEEVMPIQMGDKVVNVTINLCDKITFKQQDKQYKIKLTGMLKDNLFKLKICNQGIEYALALNGDDDYLLKPVNSCAGTDRMTIPLNKETPILTYSPPVKSNAGGLESYCILGEEDVEHWYKTFKIAHYYVIYLRIE